MANITDVKLPDSSQYDLKDNVSGYQTETLTAPIAVDGTSETTVEGALGAVNDYADKIEGSMSNENLIDNAFFTVNERGASSYSTAGEYTANRWYMSFGGLTVGISSSGATLTTTGDTVLDQKFETDELKGKTVTLSIKHFDGTTEHGTVQFPSTAGTAPVVITGGELQAGVDTYGNCYFRIVILTGNTITARAVKLELGSVSTLANDVAPDYALELAKCRASTADPSDTYANKGNLVNYADLTTIHATGSTNTTGAQIDAGTFFYLNGQFCKATADIAVNATFTLNTNYEEVTVGGDLKKLTDTVNYHNSFIPIQQYIQAQSSIVYSLSRGIYIVSVWQGGASNEFSGLWIAYISDYSGGCSVAPLVTPTIPDIVLSVSANALTITNNNTTYALDSSVILINGYM